MLTDDVTGALGVEDVVAAVELAVRAPSIHNTQPWRWVYGPRGLELYADRGRQLPVIDPDGRGLLVSCGAALYLAQLGLAARGWQATVTRFPDPAQPDLLARLVPAGRCGVDEEVRSLVAAAERRRTERRPFRRDPVPMAVLDGVAGVVEGDGVYAHVVTRGDERLDLAVVMSWADELEVEDDRYRAELIRWVRPGEVRADDGVPVSAVPRVPVGAQRHTDVPVRDFEVGRRGALPIPAGVDETAAWVVLFTDADDAVARLRAGESYARVSVLLERGGLASSAATQAVDLPGVRGRVRALMAWSDHPQMVLRVGWPPLAGLAPAPDPTPRRPVAEVLTVIDG